MNEVILFGGTGNLGKKIAEELKDNSFDVTAVVRNEKKAKEISHLAKPIVADVTNPQSLSGICNDFDIVISSLGKSVSPNDKSKPSFRKIDLNANSHILDEAVKGGIKKLFTYRHFMPKTTRTLNTFVRITIFGETDSIRN